MLFYLVELSLGSLDSLDFSQIYIVLGKEGGCGEAIFSCFKIGRKLSLFDSFLS